MAKFRRDLPPIHNPHITGANWAELYDPAPARIPDFRKTRLVHVKMWDLGRGCELAHAEVTPSSAPRARQ